MNLELIQIDNLKDHFDSIRSTMKKSDMCITYQKNNQAFDLLDREELNSQFKDFRKMKLEGSIIINPNNNKSVTDHNNKIWYTLVIQEAVNSVFDPNSGFNKDICRLGMVFGTHVSGAIYAFRKEENRDALFHYIMK